MKGKSMKTILVALATILLSTTALAYKSPLIEQFKKDGIVTMHGACVYKEEAFICMVVKSEGKEYLLIGNPGAEHIEEQYIFEVVPPNTLKEVWNHKWVEA